MNNYWCCNNYGLWYSLSQYLCIFLSLSSLTKWISNLFSKRANVIHEHMLLFFLQMYFFCDATQANIWNLKYLTYLFCAGLFMQLRKFLNASSVGNVLREAAPYQHTYWYTVIPGPTLVNIVGKDFTRNQIWRSILISTQVWNVSGQSWLLKYS